MILVRGRLMGSMVFVFRRGDRYGLEHRQVSSRGKCKFNPLAVLENTRADSLMVLCEFGLVIPLELRFYAALFFATVRVWALMSTALTMPRSVIVF